MAPTSRRLLRLGFMVLRSATSVVAESRLFFDISVKVKSEVE